MSEVREAPVRRRRPWDGLSHNVRVLSGVSFFQDAASEMLYPVLPLFITGVLGAPPSVVGLVEGMAEGTASIVKAVSWWLADRWRLRALVGRQAPDRVRDGLAAGTRGEDRRPHRQGDPRRTSRCADRRRH